MARVSTYLNFAKSTEAAFRFYAGVFGTSVVGPMRFGDIPAGPGQPPVPDSVKNLVMHIELPTLGGHVLMGTDAPEEMGFQLTQGNTTHIMLEPDTKEEGTRLFQALAADGEVKMPLQDMFWGDYYGELKDKFGVLWMVNVPAPKNP
jgi:PhnB protein